MSFLQAFLEFNKIKRTLYMLSFLWLLLISSITCASCFDVSVSPGSICCGDWVTVTISLTNNGDSVFSGRLEIYIIDANGYQDRMDGLSITLQPYESRTFQTRIRPKDCKSYGTYQVVVKLVDNNGREQGTRTSSFVVKNPTSCQLPPECTWTFTCDNNIVKRLCVDQSGKEYWKEYDDCNKYNPPRKCINGVCVDISPTCNQQTCPPPNQCIDGRCEPPCDQQACQNQNRPIGTPYTKNGLQYQKYMECSCVNHQCKCVEVEKPNQKQPSCDNCQSGPIGKPYLKDGRAYQKYQECTCVDGKCNCKSVEEEVPCKGTISGYVYDVVKKSPISDANIFFCQGICGPSSYSDASGYFSAGASCPSTNTYIDCHAEGYKSDNMPVTTDNNGNARVRFDLEPQTTKVNIELISSGYEKYRMGGVGDGLVGGVGVEEPVFFRGSQIDVGISPKPNLKSTFILVSSRSEQEYGEEVQTSETNFVLNIPENIPIGKYYIKSKESNDKSKSFYIIFNPYVGDITPDLVQNYWIDETTGPNLKVLTVTVLGDYLATWHFDKSIFEFAITTADGAESEREAIKKIASEVSGKTDNPSAAETLEDIISLKHLDLKSKIIDINNGKIVKGDCKTINPILVSLLRSIGLPSRAVSGCPDYKPITEVLQVPYNHVWAEVWDANDAKFIICDGAILAYSDGYVYPIGSSYLERIIRVIGLDNKVNSKKWSWVEDEGGLDRKQDYNL